ncbi:MAG: hypothetical protein FD126_1279 [Elusimicrobia bacterium]|nr:MAG: hypothetical protein FD126_1279 [Elusimicrobiota bacterium]
MEFMQGSCGKCGRSVKNREFRTFLDRPLCAVCGGPLVFSDADRLKLESLRVELDSLGKRAAAAQALSQHVAQLRCDFCARTTAVRGLGPGDSRPCAYCGCPFTVLADGESSSPVFALSGAPPSPAQLESAGEALSLGAFLESYRRSGDPTPPVRLAVRALQARLPRNAVPLEEARRILETLARLPGSGPPDGSSEWVCPLPADWACDLIERVLCPTRGVERDLSRAKARVLKVRTFGPLEDAFVEQRVSHAPAAKRRIEAPSTRERVGEALETAEDIVDAVEKVHSAWEKSVDAFDFADAIDAVGELDLLNLGVKALKVLDRKADGGSYVLESLEGMEGRSKAWEQDLDYAESYRDEKISHHLRITFVESEGGSSMGYTHQLSDGGSLPLDRCQKRLIYAIQRGLARFGETLVCFKAVYGDWLGAGSIQCLAEECFRERLRALHPDLESLAGVYGLVRDARRAG